MVNTNVTIPQNDMTDGVKVKSRQNGCQNHKRMAFLHNFESATAIYDLEILVAYFDMLSNREPFTHIICRLHT